LCASSAAIHPKFGVVALLARSGASCVSGKSDDYDGKVGTVQTRLDDDGDGLTIDVIF
jgi:hypothetical protein